MAISDLLGETIKEITKTDQEITFCCESGNRYLMFHQDDCSERVYIEDVIGDMSDLCDAPILRAEEKISQGEINEFIPPYFHSTSTYTFYTLATKNGYVDIRWYGSSNGYYSEKVSFVKISQ